MKNKVLFLSAFISVVLFSSCGINNAVLMNQNQISTQVQLMSNNYKVIDRVSGSSEVTYICLIGGMNKKQLFSNAYSDLVQRANLNVGARALINLVTEEQVSGVPPFYFRRTVTVSAHVIEFTK